MKEVYTRASFVDLHGPTHLCKGNGCETANGASTDHDKISSHVLNVDWETTTAVIFVGSKSPLHFHSRIRQLT